MSVPSRRLCKTKYHRPVGRSKPRPYNGCGVNENPQRVEDTLWIACVGDAPVVVSPTLSVGDA